MMLNHCTFPGTLNTNIDLSVFDAEHIAEIYSLRWRIEIVFKSWKSHFNITNVPNASATRVISYIYTTLIFIALFQTFNATS